MLSRTLSLTVAAALVLLVGAAVSTAKAAKPDDNIHAGTFVSFKDGKLVMADKDGKEKTHALTKEVKVTIDGKEAKMDDLATLAKGAPLTVTNDKDNIAVISVAAKTK